MKKILIGFVAIVVAIGAFAFTEKGTKGTSTATYHYTGSLYTNADYNLEARWTKGTATCGTAGSRLCTITAPDGGTNPDFSGLPAGGNVSTDNTIISNRVTKQ